MLVFRSLLQTNKLSLLKFNTRPNGFISSQGFLKIPLRCLSNSAKSRICLYTRTKSCLQPRNFLGSSFFQYRHLNQEPGAKQQFIPQYKADNISEDYKLIYSNGIVKYYQAVQFFLYPVSMIGIISSTYLMWTNYEDFFQRTILESDHPFFAGCIFLAACSAMIGVFSNLCRRAVLRIYINPQTGNYVAIRYPWNFLKEQISFATSQVETGETGNILPFNRGNIKIKGQPFLMVERDFIKPSEFNTMIGIQNQKL